MESLAPAHEHPFLNEVLANPGPVEMKGRKMLEKGVWLMVKLNEQAFLTKVTEENATRALDGQRFEAWHTLVVGPKGGPVYMPEILKTVEPWIMRGENADFIAVVHPELAEHLDKTLKNSLSKIISATAAEMPKDGTRGLHLA